MITHYSANIVLLYLTFYFPVLGFRYSCTARQCKPCLGISPFVNGENYSVLLFPCSIRQLAVEVVESTGGKKVTTDTLFLQ